MKRNLVFFIAIAVLMVAMLTFAACNFEPKCVASHTWDDGTVIVAPTCKTEGQMKYTCKVCGAVKKETIEKIPHTEGGWVVDSAPTCTDAGHRHTECTVCHTHVQEEDMLALDHDFGAWTVTTPATCTTKGEEERVCQREGCEHKETRDIDALDHDFGVWTVTTPATCTTNGKEERVCQREGCEHKETREIDALGHHLVDKHDGTHHWQECDREGCEYATNKVAHTESDWIVDSLVNCTDAGHKHTECTVCHTHMQEEDLPALGHDWGEWGVKKPATCTANGVEARTCERCQYTMFREIRATGHTEGEWIVDREPTCTEKGHKHTECTVCHAHIQEADIAAKGHTEGNWIVDSEPTCTAVGHKHTECSVCHTHIQEADIAAKGHSYNKETDWIAEVPATCTADGTKGHYHCDVCNKNYDKDGNELSSLTILASGHDYQTVVTAPTCTERGYTTHTCSRCDDSFVDTYVDALGHDYDVEHIVWTWNVDYTKATATFTCKNDGEHIEVIDATVAITDTVDATCEGTGLIEYTATVVFEDVEYKKVELVEVSALGHKSSEWIVDEDATCTADGLKHKECTVCHTTLEVEIIDALGHDLSDWTQTKAPTCTTDGEEERHCLRDGCDHSETQVILAKGHNYKEEDWHAEQPATCTVTGVKGHYYCDVCDKYFDKDGVEITLLVIPATGHEWGEWTQTTAPTCTEKGEEQRVCAHDATHVETRPIEATGHTEGKWIEDVEPTCTAEGHKHQVCAVCGETINTATVEPLGHHLVWKHSDTEHWQICDREGCNHATTHEAHNIVTSGGKEPTCTEPGHTAGESCSICGYLKSATEIPATGHTESEWIVDTDPTCTAVGHKHTECTVCHTHIQEADIDATGHEWGEWTQTKAPTCTEKGEEQRVCKHDATHVETRPVDAKGHTEGEWIVDREPTCTAEGHKHQVCAVCGDTIKEDSIAAKGHSYDKETDWIAEVPATCTADGTKGHYHCDVCDKNYDKEGNELSSLTISANGHDYQAVVTEPTCTERGYTTHTCAVCGDHYEDTYVDALGHDWGEWTVVEDAKCGVAGSKEHECTRCHEKETAEIPALEHKYNAVVTEPTCTEKGYTTHTCELCGDSYKDSEVDALGHIGGEATCVDKAVCTRCGHEYGEVNPNNHKHVVVDAAVAPTCETAGLKEGSHCDACGQTVVAQQTVDALGHDYGDLIDEVSATCTTNGRKAHYECGTCGKLFILDGDSYKEVDEEFLTIEAHHTLEPVDEQPATCGDAGHVQHQRCTVCGALFSMEGNEKTEADLRIEPIGHAWSEWTQTKAPTCTEKGEEQRVCAHDATHIETRDINALGHDVIHHEGKAATCTEAGWAEYDTCSRCDYTTYQVLEATGHSLTHVDEVKATCKAEGTKEHWHCGACGLDFADEEGSVVCEDTVLPIDPNNHSWNEGEITKEPTCKEQGEKTYTCTACGATKTETVPADESKHNLQEKSNGYCTWQECTTCGKGFILAEKEPITLSFADKTGVESDNSKQVWNNQNGIVFTNVKANATNNVAVYAPVRCYKGSNIIIECAGMKKIVFNCVSSYVLSLNNVDGGTVTTTGTVVTITFTTPQDSFTIENLANQTRVSSIEVTALGKVELCAEHTFGDWEVVKDATCTEAGEHKHTCTVCGFVEGEEIAQLEHKAAEGAEWIVDEESGTHYHKCATCDTVRLDEASHSTENGIHSDETQHWCECDVCGHHYEVEEHKDNDGNGNCDVCGKEMLTEEQKEALLQQQLAEAVADLKDESKLPTVEYDENNNAIITLPTLSEGIKATIVWAVDADDAGFNEDGTVTVPQTADSRTITFTATIKVDDTHSDSTVTKTATVDAKNAEATILTVSKTIADLATQHGWTDAKAKQGGKLDDIVTLSSDGGSNSGKVYADGMRIYATDTPAGSITISVAEGYELVSIKITCLTGTYADLQLNGTSVCNVETAVTGQSVKLTSVKVGSNGKQVRISAIEVKYKKIS